MGYAGGVKKDPTYRNLGDHSEAIQIDYDPDMISYEDLLNIFWKSHDPADQHGLRQYMNILFFHNKEQKQLAEETRDRVASKLKKGVATDLLPYTGFYRAEDYHQKYSLQRFPGLMDEMRALYPDFQGFVDSTTAARLNGYLGGNGTCERFMKEVEQFGLSVSGKAKIKKTVCGNESRAVCGTGKVCRDSLE